MLFHSSSQKIAACVFKRSSFTYYLCIAMALALPLTVDSTLCTCTTCVAARLGASPPQGIMRLEDISKPRMRWERRMRIVGILDVDKTCGWCDDHKFPYLFRFQPHRCIPFDPSGPWAVNNGLFGDDSADESDDSNQLRSIGDERSDGDGDVSHGDDVAVADVSEEPEAKRANIGQDPDTASEPSLEEKRGLRLHAALNRIANNSFFVQRLAQEPCLEERRKRALDAVLGRIAVTMELEAKRRRTVFSTPLSHVQLVNLDD